MTERGSDGLRLDGATYTYPAAARPALRDVSFQLSPGKVLGVMGANESGKSTLCLVASGMAPAGIGGKLTGTLTIDGRPSAGLRTDELAQRCGLLLQNPIAQLSQSTLTIFEEAALGPSNLGLPAAEVVDRARWALSVVRIEHLASRDPGRLSGGQAQLVALASVLALRPRYLILDEPTSELDPVGTRLVAESLRRVAAETGCGVLIAEHKADLLAELADSVVVLDRGAIALLGPARDVLEDPRLEELGVAGSSPARLRAAVARGGLELSADLAGAIDRAQAFELEMAAPASGSASAIAGTKTKANAKAGTEAVE